VNRFAAHAAAGFWRRALPVLIAFGVLLLASFAAHAEDPWLRSGADGQAEVQLYFFWSLTCPHCTAAHPYVDTIPQTRPWVRLHSLEVSRHPENLRQYEAMARSLGAELAGVPALLFCGEMHVGWDGDEFTGATVRQRLDECRAQASGGAATNAKPATAETIQLPLIGAVDAASLSLPALTLVLAGLDAFNPCAFFVLLFLLSMMAHQKSRPRMLLIGGIFVAVSGLMYFAFMAAWLNVFSLFGHLAWVTLAAGALAVFVGAVNVKDFFFFEKGLTLSIPESKKPDIFRRARNILGAQNMPAMIAATAFLAIAANSKLEIVSFSCEAKGTLEKVERLGYQMTEILLRPRLTIRQRRDLERAARILEKAEKNCLISNSIKSAVKLEPQIFCEQNPTVPCPPVPESAL